MGQSFIIPIQNVPIKECGTPDAKYGFKNTQDSVFFNVKFPRPLLSVKDEAAFFAEMHAAMLPVVERLYERMWGRAFAGTLDAEGRPYPQKYSDLWPEALTQPEHREESDVG